MYCTEQNVVLDKEEHAVVGTLKNALPRSQCLDTAWMLAGRSSVVVSVDMGIGGALGGVDARELSEPFQPRVERRVDDKAAQVASRLASFAKPSFADLVAFDLYQVTAGSESGY